MAWTVEFDSKVLRDLAALDAQETRRILKFLQDRVSSRDNPRAIGEALVARLVK